MELPDIVYVVRSGENNRSLRYSLRSLANLPHNRVFIGGYCPTWVTGVTIIPVHRKPNKFDTIVANLRGVLDHEELGDSCVYFNDDFYVMHEINHVPVMHGLPAAEYKPKNEMRWRYEKTLHALSLPEMFSYDGTHVPLPIDRRAAILALTQMPSGCLWRTWYGNLMSIGGMQVTDVKSRDGGVIPGPFMSSSPPVLSTLRTYLEDVLPARSPYVIS